MKTSMHEFKKLAPFAKKLKVLYVEDNFDTREQTLKMFHNFFDDIVTAVDGEDGLKKFKAGEFDLIFSDVNMPKMNGVELLEMVREIDKDVPFIIISAHNEMEYYKSSIKFGVSGYLLKPIDFNEYISILVKILQDLKVKKESSLVDELTGISNREALLNFLNSCDDSKIPVLFLINIDTFRIYNEFYGAKIANDILVESGKLFEKFLEDRDYKLFKISGDEFAFAQIADYPDIERHEEVVNALSKYLTKNHIYIDEIDEKLEISVTVGISFSNQNPLGKADMALYDAKKHGKKYSIHSTKTDTTKELENILYWKKEIRSALDENRVVPYFQPIVDREQNIVKYEALMRIEQFDKNGDKKVIVPYHFLDISIKTKQYVELSYRLIKSAIEIMKDRDISLSINLDTQDLSSLNMVSMLKRNIIEFNTYNIDKTNNRVILEILENEQINDYQLFAKQLEQFKEINAYIAIDDFGSGYSNLSHVIGISPQYLKIDATLIKNIVDDNNSRKIVESVVLFAKNLGIKTIAEYVANKEIFDVVYDIGVDEFQGYYFGKPMSIEEIDLIKDKEARLIEV